MTQIGFPFRIDGRGRTAGADAEAHVRDLIKQLLFTSPGERVNRPEFGTGVRQLVFAPNSPELGAAVEFTVQGALQRWLAEVIQIETVQVVSEEATVEITVRYLLVRTQERREITVEAQV
jgi:phage baseplate assembly protein W